MINPIDGSLQVFSTPPRKLSGTNGVDSPARGLSGVQMWGEMFKHISKLPQDVTNRRGFVSFPPPFQPQSYDVAAELQGVDLKPSNNWLYSQNSVKTAQVALNPGQHFEVDLYFYRDINFTRDLLFVTFEKENKTEKFLVDLSNKPKHSNGKFDRFKHCQGKLTHHEKEKITIDVQIPSNVSKGWWNLHVITSIQNHTEDTGSNDSESVVNGIYFT